MVLALWCLLGWGCLTSCLSPVMGRGTACGRTNTQQCRCGRRMGLRLLVVVLLLVSAVAAPTDVPSSPTPSGSAAAAACHVNFLDPQVQAAAKADLDALRAAPFDPQQLTEQFAHGIDAHLPHGVKSVVDTSEYWTDPETQLVHHRLPELSKEQFMQMVQVTRQYASKVVAYNMEQITGYTGDEPPMQIDLGQVKRIFAPPRRNYSLAELDIMEAKVEELVKAGVVHPVASSDFACNVVLAAKRAPDGTWSDKRFCVNFIPVNKPTVLDN